MRAIQDTQHFSDYEVSIMRTIDKSKEEGYEFISYEKLHELSTGKKPTSREDIYKLENTLLKLMSTLISEDIHGGRVLKTAISVVLGVKDGVETVKVIG